MRFLLSSRNLHLTSWFLVLASAGVPACETFTRTSCTTLPSCAGESSSGGKPPVDPAIKAGGASADGGGAYGGDAPSATSGGAGAVGGETGTVEPVSPQIVSVKVEGHDILTGQTPTGITSEATITFRFNVPMDGYSTWLAYSAESDPIAQSNVTYKWSEDKTELVVVPNEPLPYPDIESEDEPSLPLEFSLAEGAMSEDELPLESSFSGSFFTLRRLHRTLSPNTSRSTGRLDYSAEEAVSGFRSGNSCPSHGDVPEVLEEHDFLDRAEGLESLIATGKDGSVGIFAYDIDFADELVVLDSAELELGKWPDPSWALYASQDPGYEEITNQLDFSVDALTPGALNVGQSLETPIFSNFKNHEGEEFQRGFGLFYLDLTDWLQERLEDDEKSLSFRLEFDGKSQNPNTWQSCAALLFHVAYLVE